MGMTATDDMHTMLGRLDERTVTMAKDVTVIKEAMEAGCPYGKETRSRLRMVALILGLGGGTGVVAVKELLSLLVK